MYLLAPGQPWVSDLARTCVQCAAKSLHTCSNLQSVSIWQCSERWAMRQCSCGALGKTTLVVCVDMRCPFERKQGSNGKHGKIEKFGTQTPYLRTPKWQGFEEMRAGTDCQKYPMEIVEIYSLLSLCSLPSFLVLHAKSLLRCFSLCHKLFQVFGFPPRTRNSQQNTTDSIESEIWSFDDIIWIIWQSYWSSLCNQFLQTMARHVAGHVMDLTGIAWHRRLREPSLAAPPSSDWKLLWNTHICHVIRMLYHFIVMYFHVTLY